LAHVSRLRASLQTLWLCEPHLVELARRGDRASKSSRRDAGEL